MSAIELVSLLMSSGVCAGGVGILRWALSVERRVIALELEMKLKEG